MVEDYTTYGEPTSQDYTKHKLNYTCEHPGIEPRTLSTINQHVDKRTTSHNVPRPSAAMCNTQFYVTKLRQCHRINFDTTLFSDVDDEICNAICGEDFY